MSSASLRPLVLSRRAKGNGREVSRPASDQAEDSPPSFALSCLLLSELRGATGATATPRSNVLHETCHDPLPPLSPRHLVTSGGNHRRLLPQVAQVAARTRIMRPAGPGSHAVFWSWSERQRRGRHPSHDGRIALLRDASRCSDMEERSALTRRATSNMFRLAGLLGNGLLIVVGGIPGFPPNRISR